MLSHLPPLPIVIDIRSRDPVEIDPSVLHVILQRDRIRRIVFQAPSATSEDLIVPMNEPFPILKDLSLSSAPVPKKDTKPRVLPHTYLALNLRQFTSHSTFLSKRLPLPTSGVSLVTLEFADIQTPGYFPPGGLVPQLENVPQLQELRVGCFIPTPPPLAEGESSQPPIPLTTVPVLRRLEFCGVSACLESFLSHISAPLLERFNISLFGELTSLPRLSHFIRTTKGLRHWFANIILNRRTVLFVVGSSEEPSVSLHVSCSHFDSPSDSVTQVCGALVPVLSYAEKIILRSEESSLPSDWQDEVDGIAWHDLLGPFSNVKKLYIGHPFASGFSRMQSDDAELVLGLLPELQELEAELGIIQAHTAFAGFINARQLAGRPVRLSAIRVPLAPLQTEVCPTWALQKIVRHDESALFRECFILTTPQSGTGPATVGAKIRATRV
jgi:hypothetical protein